MIAVLQELSPSLRPLGLSDLPEVLAIERVAYPFPWTERVLRDCIDGSYSCWAMEQAGAIVGYGILSIAVGEAQILNLCVSPERQGKGLGRLLMENLITLSRRQKAEILFLEVRASNKIAQMLYHNMGFNQIGSRRNYYPARQGREDAVLMALDLVDPNTLLV
ncbi:MAG: ribosomal protein S18-alanine N-acetyltransferase [Gammaproteobacteria bacterium]|nr:ribosomal protein S18-alanine N-acetyltransferase [Gammaproteobacteria bacterium]MBU1654655.1 ribosomal protein S18-alanine N-acetyltransferase [Gammaproteobacteria bacterium]MBU1962451.1 ribosomal protein S18-alanine N-acetyltransferase [Gammaproteobacteria bacterium]